MYHPIQILKIEDLGKSKGKCRIISNLIDVMGEC